MAGVRVSQRRIAAACEAMAAYLDGSPAAHRHMVLFRSRGRDGVTGCRMAQRLVLARERRRRAVRNHEARVEAALAHQERWQAAQLRIDEALGAALGDVGQLVHGDREIVHRLAGILAVKVAPAEDLLCVGCARRLA